MLLPALFSPDLFLFACLNAVLDSDLSFLMGFVALVKWVLESGNCLTNVVKEVWIGVHLKLG